MKPIGTLLILLFALTSCAQKPEAAIDQATVVANNTSVRQRNSSTSRTLRTLDAGDQVEIIEKQDNWYRIRSEGSLLGWMEESTLVTRETERRIKTIVAQSTGQAIQNTGVLREDANFRIEPGRTSPIIRKLEAGARIEILDRVTTLRPSSKSSRDVWLKVRASPVEAGWLYSSLVEFDVPADIAQYTEGYTYAAVKKLLEVQDPLAGPINWFIVGERGPGTSADIDFDGIRVFTWNMKKHRYETAYRTRGIRGVYPLEAGQQGNSPMFRLYELHEDGATKVPREFVMTGVIVREVKKIS